MLGKARRAQPARGNVARPRATVTEKHLSCASASVLIQLAFTKQMKFKLIVALPAAQGVNSCSAARARKGMSEGCPELPGPSHSTPPCTEEPRGLGKARAREEGRTNTGNYKASSEGRGNQAALRPEQTATTSHSHLRCLQASAQAGSSLSFLPKHEHFFLDTLQLPVKNVTGQKENAPPTQAHFCRD